MRQSNLKYIFFSALVLLLISATSVSAAFSGVGILSSQISSDVIDLESANNIQINTSIVNYDDNIRAELKLDYKLVNTADGTEIINEQKIISLGGYEVKDITKTLTIPNTINKGNYKIVIFVNGPNNIPLAGFTHKLEIYNNNINGQVYITKGPYLKIPLNSDSGTTSYIESYGTTGSNVPQNIEYYLNFNIKNENENYNNLKAIIEIIPTLGDTPLKTIEHKLHNFSTKTTTDTYELTMNFDIPGTYRVLVSIYNADNFLFKKEVRLVIAGEGASILRVKNTQDTYLIGETIQLSSELVGPADGATKLKDIYLKLILSQNNIILKEITNNIPNLEFDTITESIEFISEWNLKEYKVQLILGKGDTIYDETTINYEPIEVKKMITPDGRIFSKGSCFDNNICTTEERQINNCYDCYLEDQPKPIETNIVNNNNMQDNLNDDNNNEKPSIILMIIFIIMIPIIIFGIYKFWGAKK